MTWTDTRRPRLTCEALEDRSVPAVIIQFDYSLDTKGFFNVPARRTALVDAAKALAWRLDDTLSAISPSGTNTWKASFPNPATGATVTKPNMTIPANTLRVFVGGRDLPGETLGIGGPGGRSSSGSSTWNNLVKSRGESGALAASPTDVAPWGGALTFDTATAWHFGRTTVGLNSDETDFRSVAMHELGHLLGIVSGEASWDRLISNRMFIGAAAKAENAGSPVPVSPDGGHFREGTKSDGLEVAMDPSVTAGTRKFFSRLDFAALEDIGWEVGTRNDTIHQASHWLTGEVPDGQLSLESSVISTGRIGSSARDVDMYRVYIYAGSLLTVSTTGYNATPVNTYLKLFDAAGTQLRSANQGGAGGKDTLTYTVTRNDYYYVAVSSAGNTSYNPFAANSGTSGTTGDYRLSVGIET